MSRLCQIGVALLIAASPLSCVTQRVPSGAPVPDEHDLADVDSNLAALRPILRGYPPKLASPEQRREVTHQWKETEAQLREMSETYPHDAALQWRLGALYRFGHTLDMPGAGAECVSHLGRAIALRPNYVDAYLELGIFYTDAGPQWAQLGETNLKKAIALSAPTLLPRGWRALCFALYYNIRGGSRIRSPPPLSTCRSCPTTKTSSSSRWSHSRLHRGVPKVSHPSAGSPSRDLRRLTRALQPRAGAGTVKKRRAQRGSRLSAETLCSRSGTSGPRRECRRRCGGRRRPWRASPRAPATFGDRRTYRGRMLLVTPPGRPRPSRAALR
jgi:hypothetical protein